MGRLIAISNRTAADPKARAGGLAVAVWESLKATGGSWFGWSGRLVDDAPRGASVMRDEGVEFVLTDLTHEEHDGFYLNYANRVIWPVFHYRLDLAAFDSDAFKIYSAVNQRMADLVSDRLVDTDTVWVHDYHFLLMGEALRHAGWEGPTGFFLHIPFPPPEMFRAIPEHHWIARAMCAYDVIGFQSSRDRSNFVRYLVDDCGGTELDGDRVDVFGTTTRVSAYPIGIDPKGFAEAARSPEADRAAERIGRFLGNRHLVIGVDRMDYSKGLPERFEAVGQFFDDHPEMDGQVSVTQIAPPSRSKVEEYQELRLELDQLAGRINGDHGDLDWIPLRYLGAILRPRGAGRPVSHRPRRPRHPAAGRHEPRGQGVHHRPGRKRSGRIGPVRIRRRCRTAQTGPHREPTRQVQGGRDHPPGPHHVARGAPGAMARTARCRAATGYRLVARMLPQGPAKRPATRRVTMNELTPRRATGAAKPPDGIGLDIRNRALFLDFDGTLAAIQDDPDTVALPVGGSEVLVRLSAAMNGALAIVSGRDMRDLERRIPPDLWRVGGHGHEVCAPGEHAGEDRPDVPVSLSDPLREAVDAVEGAWLEAKGPILALHYRAAPAAEETLTARATACCAIIPATSCSAEKWSWKSSRTE